MRLHKTKGSPHSCSFLAGQRRRILHLRGIRALVSSLNLHTNLFSCPLTISPQILRPCYNDIPLADSFSAAGRASAHRWTTCALALPNTAPPPLNLKQLNKQSSLLMERNARSDLF
eukprot:scaffold646643_cov23-Prasinocladus_malaysianus.AAC.2